MSNGVDTSLRIRLLGAFSLSLGDATLVDHVWSRNRASALIKLLALQPSRALHREQVLDALWPDLDAASAANNLDKNVHYIRTELEKHGIDTPLVVRSGGAVSLDRNALVDVEAFRQAAAAARAARTNPLLYAHAFSLFGGELLPLDRYESWTAAPRDELAMLYGHLVIETTQLHEIRSEWRPALDCLERLGRHHTDEEAYRAEMRIYALSGQQDAALLAYERCRDALAEEFGAAPSRKTEALRSDIAHARIRRRSRLAHVPDDPLVGRQTELARLVGALEDAFEGGGGLALISGEPGIGKTRLAEELATHAHLRGGHVLWGRCDPSEAAPAFGPWIQAIQTYIEDASGGPKPTLELPLLSSPGSGDETNPAQGRKRLFDSVTTLFKLAADSRSVLLVLDDLHDADAASLQLLRHIAREAPSMNLLVVGTFRDTELDPDDSLSVALGGLVREHLKMRIELGGLSEDEVGQFVELTIGSGTGAALVSAIHDETAGNPFFVKECALALGDASKLPRGGRRFGVPSNARDAVLRRIDRLSPACRDVLAAASAVGRRFERAMVVKVSGMKPGAVLEALDEASRTRVIEPQPDAEDAWMFAHGLTRQAIYERMSARRRADLHGRVAATLEARGESDPAELAHHFVAAARGGGDPEKAIGYALRAGEEALARFAWEPAISHWETACRMMEEHNADPEQLADVLERLEMLIFNAGGDRGAALRHLEHALVLRQALGQEERVAQVHSRLGRALSTRVGPDDMPHMNFERALDHFRAAEPVLTKSDDRAALAYFYSGMAGSAANSANVPDGFSACERGIEIAEQLEDRSQLAPLLLLKGGFLKMQGRFAESAALMSEAYALGDSENNPLVTFLAVTNIGDWTEGYAGGRGDLFERELQHPRMASGPQRLGLLGDLARMAWRNGDIERMRQIAPEANDPSLNALIAYCDGDLGAADRDLSAGMDTLRQVGNRHSYANRAHLLAEVKLALDDPASAEQLLRGELAIGLDGGTEVMAMRASAELAMICVRDGRLEEADRLLERCRRALEDSEDWGRRAGRSLLAEAMLATAHGRDADSRTYFERALLTFTERRLAWDEADAYVQLARTLERCGASARAGELLECARSTYRRIHAGPAWLNRAATPEAQ